MINLSFQESLHHQLIGDLDEREDTESVEPMTPDAFAAAVVAL